MFSKNGSRRIRTEYYLSMRYDTQANIQTNHYITFDTDETKGKDPRMKVWKVERYSVMVQLHQELAKLVLVQSLDQQSTIVEEEGIQLGSSVV